VYRFLLCGVVVACAVSDVRAQELSQEERINRLLDTLKSGQLEAQKKAAHQVWDAIFYKGIGTLRAKDVVAALADALSHKDEYVREFAMKALAYVRDESALPIFIKGLDDTNPTVRSCACVGLYQLGPKAKEALPALTAKIKEGKVTAFDALAKIAGTDAVPTILEALRHNKLSNDATHTAVNVLAEYPDPRAAEFMGKVFDERKHLVLTAIYFAAMDDDAALPRLRKCLTILPPPNSGGPLSTPVSDARSVRKLAVEALGKRKDKESFDTILKMVNDDPSAGVQTAAAVALGQYADKRAVPALVKALGQKDSGFEAEGHTGGALREAAVRSLGTIGTEEALAALYAGAKDGPAKQQCVGFWVNTREAKHLGAFLKLYDTKPMDATLAAGIIQSLFRNQEEKKLTAKEKTAAEEEFFKNVDDPARFGPKADLSEGGKWIVRVEYTFPADGFAVVAFNFRDINPMGFGHGYTVLYRKTGEKWKPMSKTSQRRE
jgi:HEAT repeat protein